MKVELEIPKELEREARKFVKNIDLEKLLPEIMARGIGIFALLLIKIVCILILELSLPILA